MTRHCRQRFGFAPFDVEDAVNLDLYIMTKDSATPRNEQTKQVSF